MCSLLEKMLSRTVQEGSCMVWGGCLNSDGYPRATVSGNSNIKVHRLVYELSTGTSPKGLVVRHTCDNPRCINPHHLLAGTPKDNADDRRERGRTAGHVDASEIKEVGKLRASGLTYKEISDTLQIKYKRVEYIVNKYIKPLKAGG